MPKEKPKEQAKLFKDGNGGKANKSKATNDVPIRVPADSCLGREVVSNGCVQVDLEKGAEEGCHVSLGAENLIFQAA